MISPADLKSSPWRMVMHVKLGRGGWQTTHRCQRFPDATVVTGRATTVEPVTRAFYVGPVACYGLDDVCEH